MPNKALKLDKPKVFRTTISFEQEDRDILDFFNKKGSNDSTTFKMALREFYRTHATKATVPVNPADVPVISTDE